MKIHVIEPLNHLVKLQDSIWESGSWRLEEEKAKALVGGEIYFHKKRHEPSFYGGTILGYRVNQIEENQGEVIFQLQYGPSFRNVVTDKTGWKKNLKIG
jgi:hypothetical protein